CSAAAPGRLGPPARPTVVRRERPHPRTGGRDGASPAGAGRGGLGGSGRTRRVRADGAGRRGRARRAAPRAVGGREGARRPLTGASPPPLGGRSTGVLTLRTTALYSPRRPRGTGWRLFTFSSPWRCCWPPTSCSGNRRLNPPPRRRNGG